VPTYQYACVECGNQLEVVQKFTDEALRECPECEGRLRKVFSAVGVVFKGSGFYRNDSRSGQGASRSSGDGDGKSADSKTSETKSSDSKSAGSGDSSSSSSGDGKGASGGSKAPKEASKGSGSSGRSKAESAA
jgi:putative FmdB family regulatory protein